MQLHHHVSCANCNYRGASLDPSTRGPPGLRFQRLGGLNGGFFIIFIQCPRTARRGARGGTANVDIHNLLALRRGDHEAIEPLVVDGRPCAWRGRAVSAWAMFWNVLRLLHLVTWKTGQGTLAGSMHSSRFVVTKLTDAMLDGSVAGHLKISGTVYAQFATRH